MPNFSITSDTDRTGTSGSFFRRAARAAGAFTAAAVLAVGGASAAQAATNPITSGHNDILKIKTAANGGIGTEFNNGTHESWPLATNYTYKFDLDLANPSVCNPATGVITVPAFPAAGQGPSVGFDNHSGANYTVKLTASKPVTFNGGSTFSIASGTTATLNNGTHVHGPWTVKAGSCSGGTFDLEFSVTDGSSVEDQSFTFDIS